MSEPKRALNHVSQIAYARQWDSSRNATPADAPEREARLEKECGELKARLEELTDPDDDGSVHVPIKSKVVETWIRRSERDAALAERDALKTRNARLEEIVRKALDEEPGWRWLGHRVLEEKT